MLRDSIGSLSIELLDGSDPVSGVDFTGAVHVFDSLGTEVAGSPYNGVEDPDGTGVYVAQVGPFSILDTYSVEWRIAATSEIRRQEFEIVGAFTFALAELREFAPELASESAFTDAALQVARDKAETRMEHAAGVAFRPKGRRLDPFTGTGRDTLVVPDPFPHVLSAAQISGVAFTTDELAEVAFDTISIRRPFSKTWGSGFGNNDCGVLYEHGYRSTPADVSHAAQLLAIDYLRQDARPSRALGEATDAGIFPLSIPNPGRGRSTGIPDVDAAIAEWGMRTGLYV